MPAQATKSTEVVPDNLNPVWQADTFSYEIMLDGSPIDILRDEMRIEVRHSRRRDARLMAAMGLEARRGCAGV